MAKETHRAYEWSGFWFVMSVLGGVMLFLLGVCFGIAFLATALAS